MLFDGFDRAAWIKERDEVVCTFDVTKFKVFYAKYAAIGVYDGMLPSDEVIEASLRYMVLAMENPPKDKAKAAREWLEAHGMAPGW